MLSRKENMGLLRANNPNPSLVSYLALNYKLFKFGRFFSHDL